MERRKRRRRRRRRQVISLSHSGTSLHPDNLIRGKGESTSGYGKEEEEERGGGMLRTVVLVWRERRRVTERGSASLSLLSITHLKFRWEEKGCLPACLPPACLFASFSPLPYPFCSSFLQRIHKHSFPPPCLGTWTEAASRPPPFGLKIFLPASLGAAAAEPDE